MGWRPDFQEEVQDGGDPEARRHDGWEFQEDCLEVLPGEDRSLPFRAVPSIDEEPAHRPVLVVSVPDADSESPLQGVPRVEAPAEDPVGRGA